MARDESSREDLLREATALVERIEFVLRTPEPQQIVAGFRRDGALTIFFGEDPVYQFNAAGELRRAYREGKLLKAASGRLAALERVRTQNEVQLVRHEMSGEEATAFLNQMNDRLRRLADIIDANLVEVVGQVPPEVDVLSRLRECLTSNDRRTIAEKPNA